MEKKRKDFCMKRKKNDSDSCLVCGQSTQTPRRGSRGLCDVHYRRFLKKLNSLQSDEERTSFDDKCVARGVLLEKKPGGPKKMDDDPFDDILAETKADYAKSEANEAKEAIKEAKILTDRAVAKRKSARKTTKPDSGSR